MKLGVGARPWAGLDIGAYSVKLVALHPGAAKGRYAGGSSPASAGGIGASA